MSATEMKSYRERKKLKQAASVQGSGSAPSGRADTSATVSATPTRKRPHEEIGQDDGRSAEPEHDPDVEILEATPLSTVHPPPSGPAKVGRQDKGKSTRMNLRVTSDANEIGSLWHRDFPMPEMIDAHLTGPNDDEKLHGLDLLGCLRAAQAYGCWVASVTRAAERHWGNSDKACREAIRAYNKSKEKVSELEGQLTKMGDLEHNVGVLREANNEWARARDDWNREKLELEQKVSSLTTSLEVERAGRQLDGEVIAELKKQIVLLQNDKEELKEEIAEQHELGFDKALDQVRLLFPDLDLSPTGCFKEIKDGQLVEVEVVEAEGPLDGTIEEGGRAE